MELRGEVVNLRRELEQTRMQVERVTTDQAPLRGRGLDVGNSGDASCDALPYFCVACITIDE